MDEYREANRRNWDERAAHHPDTEFYDVEGFLAGESSLLPLEREEFGPIVGPGTSLLHLQCHFGLDTLSWAREGAEVVGVDFSEEAVETARDLAAEAGLDDRAEFVESDVYDLPAALDREFDAVFTSYGVLGWLPDVERWAEVVAQFAKPGGTFYVAEIHPVAGVFEDVVDGVAEFAYPYFEHDEPLAFDFDGSYADEDAGFEHTRQYEWSHGLGEIVTALRAAGLEIEFLHEHPWSCFEQYPGMTEDDEGRWWFTGDVELPLTFSLKATKP